MLTGGRKRVLLVLFVPSVERDGATSIDQTPWVEPTLEMLGRVFGGATAYPKAKGAGVTTSEVVRSWWTSRSSSIAIRRRSTSRTPPNSLGSGVSAEEWAEKLARGKSGLSSEMSTSPSATSKRSRR